MGGKNPKTQFTFLWSNQIYLSNLTCVKATLVWLRPSVTFLKMYAGLWLRDPSSSLNVGCPHYIAKLCVGRKEASVTGNDCKRMPNTLHATLHGFTSGERQMLALMNTAGSYFFVSFPPVAPCKTESIDQKAELGSRPRGKQTPWELGATTEPPLRQEINVLTAALSCDSTSSKSWAHVRISGCTPREMGKARYWPAQGELKAL